MAPIHAVPGRRGSRVVIALVAILLAAALAPQAGLAQAPGEDKALGRPATASSVELESGGLTACRTGICVPGNATDGNPETRWASDFLEGQSWQVDLGGPRLVETVAVEWQVAYARRYEISTSLDGADFAPAASVSVPGGVRDRFIARTTFAVRAARFVRITSTRNATPYGISFYTVNVFGPADAAPPPPAVPAGSASVAPPAPPPPAGPSAAGTGGPGTAPAAGGPAPAGQGPTALRPLQDATVRLRGTATARATTIELLAVRAPRAARVRVRCKGPGCPRSVPTRRGSGRIRQLHRRLGVGAVIEIFVTQPGTTGKYTRFVIRSRKAPLRQDRCVLRGVPAR